MAKSYRVHVDLTARQSAFLLKVAKHWGYKSVQAFVQSLALDMIRDTLADPEVAQEAGISIFDWPDLMAQILEADPDEAVSIISSWGGPDLSPYFGNA
jgi:hypothetical protein